MANKTQPVDHPPAEFIASVEHPVRRADAEFLLDWFSEVSGYEPVMWGPSIIGYGRYHYRYESGREGDSPVTGFSPRKANLAIYLMPGYEDLQDQLAVLGKHKMGKSCLSVNKLADINLTVLSEMVRTSVAKMQKNYETFDR